MRKVILTAFFLLGLFTYAQIGDNVLHCSCMHFETTGQNSCSTGVSYTVVAGTGGCCSGTANTASVVTMHMNFSGITSVDYTEMDGEFGQFLCC